MGGWDAAESAWVDPAARVAAGWVDASVGRAYVGLQGTTDVEHLLGDVHQPALVLRGEPGPVPTQPIQRVAARIAGARYRQYNDADHEQWADFIRQFVQPSSAGVRTVSATAPGGLRTVLVTDIVGHTEMMQRLGDDARAAMSCATTNASRARR